jgi:hypothetical protein
MSKRRIKQTADREVEGMSTGASRSLTPGERPPDPKPMTVKDFVIHNLRNVLIEGGYDGLLNEVSECSCENDDLDPCGYMSLECEAGHKEPCPSQTGGSCDLGLENCEWHMLAGPRAKERQSDGKAKA